MKYIILWILFLFSTVFCFGQNVDAAFGNGVSFQAADSSFKVKFSVRFQSLYNGALDLETDSWDDQFLIRRSRLKFGGYAYSPKLAYKIELGLSNRDNGKVTSESNLAANIILDAVLKYKFARNWAVWIGQTKLPGNRERLISSQKLQFVDRSRLNSKFNIDRGMSVQLHHKHVLGQVILREAFSVSFGEGRNRTASNIGGYEYTSRIEILPFGEFESKGDYFGSDLKREQSPKLAIGITYDQNNDTRRVSGFRGELLNESKDQKLYFVDAMFKYRGFSSMLEYARKWTDGSPVVSDGSYYTGSGINIQAGYLLYSNTELALRYTSISPEEETLRETIKEYTFGVSKYIVGHSLKIQSDMTYQYNEIFNDQLIYRFQVELSL